MWAETYDSNMTEVFRIQSDLAERVAQSLDITVLDPQRQALQSQLTENLEAYDYYLRGNVYTERGCYQEENARVAVQMFQKAVDLDPQGDPAKPDYWAASHAVHGSPGWDEKIATPALDHNDRPDQYALRQNYPNPFNSFTTIQFDLPIQCRVRLSVFNILGQHVQTLVDHELNAGVHSVRWNAADFSGGLYFYRIQAHEFTSTKKLILIK